MDYHRDIARAAIEAINEDRIILRRKWLEGICSSLFAMEKLPTGKLGDWAFIFREQLKDLLEP